MQTEQLNDDERKDIAAYIHKKKKNTYQLIVVVGIFLFIFALPMGIATETWCILSILSIILIWWSCFSFWLKRVKKDLKSDLKISSKAVVIKKIATGYGKTNTPSYFFITIQTEPENKLIKRLIISGEVYRILNNEDRIQISWLTKSKLILPLSKLFRL